MNRYLIGAGLIFAALAAAWWHGRAVGIDAAEDRQRAAVERLEEKLRDEEARGEDLEKQLAAFEAALPTEQEIRDAVRVDGADAPIPGALLRAYDGR